MSVQNSVGYDAYPVPVGTIVPFFLTSGKIPPSWLLCDGSVLVEADYRELYSVIGTNYTLSADPSPVFRLPSLTIPANYIQPSLTRSVGLLPPEIATSDTAVLTAANIPPIDATKFTSTHPTIANFSKFPAIQEKGVALNKVKAIGLPGQLPQLIWDDTDTQVSVPFTAIASAFTATRVGADAPITITINDDYPVQYGGISCLYIIKAIGLPQNDDQLRLVSQTLDAVLAQQAQFVVQSQAIETNNAALFSPVSPLGILVVEANDSEAALAALGQGGGTTPAYSNVVGSATFCPALSGFLIAPNPEF